MSDSMPVSLFTSPDSPAATGLCWLPCCRPARRRSACRCPSPAAGLRHSPTGLPACLPAGRTDGNGRVNLEVSRFTGTSGYSRSSFALSEAARQENADASSDLLRMVKRRDAANVKGTRQIGGNIKDSTRKLEATGKDITSLQI